MVKKEEVEDVDCRQWKSKDYPVEITSTNNPSRYEFNINRIPRETKDYQLEIKADGAPVQIDHTQSEEILIPAKDGFRFLTAERIDQPENGIEVVFSTPYPIPRI